MSTTVEKKDFGVDYVLPVSSYPIDVQSCSVRRRVSVRRGCSYKVRPREALVLWT